ncbi:WhiB family transcriptional regulator [Cellulomonas gilvus]|uniref:Transcription factor WhiB n=1 Tax=Cellulomonas gilvus (strain ATCC 13127 / NRRL B-14078) TaxID=593907 RepID=F8A2Z2_CELGA|nr:WhiB family transcriptional regulator [Cellulomonas gilvus]AEI11847.1 transcription factor WhiB [Cellulomonas gilvus ATCC 13127]
MLATEIPTLSAPPACSDDPELFFPASSLHVAQAEAAKRVCAGCPARRDCLTFALTHAVHGIWGGTTEADRVRIQRAHGLPKRVAWTGAPLVRDDDTTTTTDSTSED